MRWEGGGGYECGVGEGGGGGGGWYVRMCMQCTKTFSFNVFIYPVRLMYSYILFA